MFRLIANAQGKTMNEANLLAHFYTDSMMTSMAADHTTHNVGCIPHSVVGTFEHQLCDCIKPLQSI